MLTVRQTRALNELYTAFSLPPQPKSTAPVTDRLGFWQKEIIRVLENGAIAGEDAIELIKQQTHAPKKGEDRRRDCLVRAIRDLIETGKLFSINGNLSLSAPSTELPDFLEG